MSNSLVVNANSNLGSESDITTNWGTQNYISIPSVQDFTEAVLTAACRQKLSPDELKLVINPLLGSPEIDHWALQLTTEATNDEAKAEILFEALAHRARKSNARTEGAMRTAREAFAAWNSPEEPLYCMDYAFLYVVMARAVGIKAYDVYVEKEADGQEAPHACAAIILKNKSLLVDPGWLWFGVPHKKFIVLNDLQATGIYMGQLPDMKDSEIACKLAPNFALVQLNFFEHLVENGRLNEAQEVLPIIKRLDTNAATGDYVGAKLSLLQNRPEDAIDLLLKAIAINSHESTYYTSLAEAYVEAGKVTNALESYQNALRCPITAADMERVRSCIARSNELAAVSWCYLARKMQSKGDLDGALNTYDKAIRQAPEYADAYMGRAYVKQAKGDTNGASIDYRRAIQLKPDLASKVGP
ncbi:MAG: tetratricopeptide repeat protein [Verrucomicrobiota bacterium]|jgi:tetratricopeptide (TPR) repeat protein